jgi:hypothetical protein
MNRQNILRGPGRITYDAAVIHSNTPIEADLIVESFEVSSEAFGPVDRRVANKRLEIRCTPTMWNDLAKLFPYMTMLPGTSIFGSTDKSVLVTPAAGAALTALSGAITQLPSIRLSPRQSILGPMAWTGLLKNNGLTANVADYYTLGSPATTALTGLDMTKIPNVAYMGNYDYVEDIETVDGFQIDWELELEPITTDNGGTLDMAFVSLAAVCRFTPLGMTEAAYFGLVNGTGGGFDAGIGKSMEGQDLVITGAGVGSPIITLHRMVVDQVATRYGARVGRLGEVVMRSNRLHAFTTATALAPVATFATVAG